MQPGKRISLDIDDALWNRLDMASEKPGDKKAIVTAAIKTELDRLNIPEPPDGYEPKNKNRHKKRTNLMAGVRQLYQEGRF